MSDKNKNFLSPSIWSIGGALTSTYYTYTNPIVENLESSERLASAAISAGGTYLLCKFGRVAGKYTGYGASALTGAFSGGALMPKGQKSDGILAGAAGGTIVGAFGISQAFALAGFIYGGMLGHEKSQDLAIDLFTKNDPDHTGLHIDHQQDNSIALSPTVAAPTL